MMSLKMSPRQPLAMVQPLALASSAKPHNACDECRSRKLKCSGEFTGCARCLADGATCLYSPRKQMGRPRKRKREEETPPTSHHHWGLSDITSCQMIASSQPQDSTESLNAIDPQAEGSRYTGSDVAGGGFTNLDRGNKANGLGFTDPSQYRFISNISDTNSTFGSPYSFTSTNISDYGGWMPDQDLLLPPTTIFGETQQLPTPPFSTYQTFWDSENRAIDSPACDCIPTLYKTLSSFPSTPKPKFSVVINLLKQAASIARNLLRCENCPRSYSTALQNSAGLATLANLIIIEYAKILKQADERSKEGGYICYRIGELATSGTQHMHAGAPDCPMGITVDLTGTEWRILVRAAVRKEAFGDDAWSDSLSKILEGMKHRQVRWHDVFCGVNHHHAHDTAPMMHREQSMNGCICTRILYIDHLRRSLDNLGL